MSQSVVIETKVNLYCKHNVGPQFWSYHDGNHLNGVKEMAFANTEINGFVTATKLGTRNEFFVAATKNFDTATKRFVDRTKHFVVVTKYFCYPYFNK